MNPPMDGIGFIEMPQMLVLRRGQGGGDEAVIPGTNAALMLYYYYEVGYKLAEAPNVHPQLHILQHSSIIT